MKILGSTTPHKAPPTTIIPRAVLVEAGLTGLSLLPQYFSMGASKISLQQYPGPTFWRGVNPQIPTPWRSLTISNRLLVFSHYTTQLSNFRPCQNYRIFWAPFWVWHLVEIKLKSHLSNSKENQDSVTRPGFAPKMSFRINSSHAHDQLLYIRLSLWS